MTDSNADENFYHLDVEWNRDKIIGMCEGLYEDYTGYRYFCVMSNFYALDRVNDHYYEYRDDEKAVAALHDIVQENFLEIFECANFVAIDREFNRYLESRSKQTF